MSLGLEGEPINDKGPYKQLWDYKGGFCKQLTRGLDRRP